MGSVPVPSYVNVAGCHLGCNIASRYSNKMLVQGNVFTNNFGGVLLYTDAGRYAGGLTTDSNCTPNAGVLNQNNNATYYTQNSQLQDTNGDVSVSGDNVTVPSSMQTVCPGYGNNNPGFNQGGALGATQAVPMTPMVGMAVYDQPTGQFIGHVATASSPNAFTLDGNAVGTLTNADIVASAYGGCGVADEQPANSGPGDITGTPAEPYWDNCFFASRNVKVSGNTFATNATTVPILHAGELLRLQRCVVFHSGELDGAAVLGSRPRVYYAGVRR